MPTVRRRRVKTEKRSHWIRKWKIKRAHRWMNEATFWSQTDIKGILMFSSCLIIWSSRRLQMLTWAPRCWKLKTRRKSCSRKTGVWPEGGSISMQRSDDWTRWVKGTKEFLHQSKRVSSVCSLQQQQRDHGWFHVFSGSRRGTSDCSASRGEPWNTTWSLETSGELWSS